MIPINEQLNLTVLSQIKQHPALQALPVMMLTTSVAQEDVAQAYTLHASAYLTKAVNFEGFVCPDQAINGGLVTPS